MLQVYDPVRKCKVDHGQLFWESIEFCEAEKVKKLLQTPKIDAQDESQPYFYALGFAAQRGSLQTVKVLLEDGRFNVSTNNYYAFFKAIEKGHIDILRLLLTHPQSNINPSIYANHAILVAVQNNRTDVLQLLVSHPLSNPADNHNAALKYAILNAQEEHVDILLSDSKVKATARQSIEFNALSLKHIPMLRKILVEIQLPFHKIADFAFSKSQKSHYKHNAMVLRHLAGYFARHNDADYFRKLCTHPKVGIPSKSELGRVVPSQELRKGKDADISVLCAEIVRLQEMSDVIDDVLLGQNLKKYCHVVDFQTGVKVLIQMTKNQLRMNYVKQSDEPSVQINQENEDKNLAADAILEQYNELNNLQPTLAFEPGSRPATPLMIFSYQSKGESVFGAPNSQLTLPSSTMTLPSSFNSVSSMDSIRTIHSCLAVENRCTSPSPRVA